MNIGGMNFSTEDLLGGSEGKVPSGFVCIEDTLDTPISFLIPHFLKLSLVDGYKVLFVALDEAVGHYELILRKFMINLTSFVESGQLVMLDWLKEGHLCQSECSIKSVYQDIHAEMLKLAGDSTCKIALIVDCMTTMHSILCDDQPYEWISSLQYFTSMGYRLGLDYSFVSLFHVDIEDDQTWLRWMRHVADVQIASQPLDLISMVDVDGRVDVTVRGADCCGNYSGCVDRLYYKVKDNGVRFSPSISVPT